MRPPTATELLQVWETGLNEPLIKKNLRLLAVACPATNLDAVAALSIGERDARLLLLREWLFGSRLYNTAHCPECATSVEWETDINALRLKPLLPEEASKEFCLEADGFQLRFRLLTSNDLMKATFSNAHAANELLAACILDVRHKQQPYEKDALPETVWEMLRQRISEEDPQADIQMLVQCPACSHSWEMPFDIMSYLWIEIDNWAKHMLQDVFILARAFSWSERDILSMSAQRRQFYLEMLRS